MRLIADANVLLAAVAGGPAKPVLKNPKVEEAISAETLPGEIRPYAGKFPMLHRPLHRLHALNWRGRVNVVLAGTRPAVRCRPAPRRLSEPAQEITMTEIAPSIEVDEHVRFGKPVIRGTRVRVDLVVGKLAGGMTTEEVAEEYGLTREDVLAALAYAARAVADEQIRAVK